MSKTQTPPPKKPYKPPVVEEYGAIREITRNVGATGMNDAGSSNKTKTSL